MKKMKAILAVCLAAAVIVPFAACSKGSNTVTMSTNAEFEPFEYQSNGKIVGIDIDISNKIAQKLCKELKVRNVDFDALPTELSTGKCDFAAAGMTVSEDKKKNMDFSDTYFDASQAIIVVKGSSITNRAGLNKKTVGVQQGTTGDIYCTDEKHEHDIKVNTKRYNKITDAISDLVAGRIDAVVIDDFPAQKYVAKNPDKLVKLGDALTVEHYAIGVKKGNKEMLETVNSVLKDLKSSGELDKIVAKYKTNLLNSK